MTIPHTCYLHIGTEKTGTTTIQRFLSAYRKDLSKKGILFPRTLGEDNQMRLAVYAMQAGRITDLQMLYGIKSPADTDSFRSVTAAGLRREIEEERAKCCIMSSEHCSSRLNTEAEIERLYEFLSSLFTKIVVVIYIRRQDELLLSSYSTDVKFGRTTPCLVPKPNEMSDQYDYDRLLSRWAQIFGVEALIVRRFDPAWLFKGDVLDDFLSIVMPGVCDEYEKISNENPSLDYEMLEWLRRFNNYSPFIHGEKINSRRGNIAHYLELISNGPRVTIDESELLEFMERFRDSNRAVADRYFGGAVQTSGDPLFGLPPDRSARRQLAPLTVDRCIEIAATLWTLKHQEVLDLRRQIEKMTEAT